MHSAATELPTTAHTTRKQIRGSSLLLAGRLLSSAVNFAAQLLLARYLSTADYGALAYALAVVAFCQVFCTLGLQKGIPRFVPIYHERHDYERLFGTIVLALGTLLGAVLALAALVYAAGGTIFGLLTADQQAVALLAIVVFLIPVQALDDLLLSLFVSLARPRAIFFRKHVLGPSLKLGVVVALIGLHADVTFAAYGYLVASLVGVLLYAALLVRLLRQEKLLDRLRIRHITIPARELFSFSIPVLSSELVAGGVLSAIGIFLLARAHDVSEVAFYRVALPAAHLNMIVLQSFSLLYTPLAARLFARSDQEGIRQLYWSTTAWLAVLTFPIFVVTFSLAEPLTVLLFGERYERSGMILALLAAGYYFNAALGLNSQTLRVIGAVRYLLAVNLLSLLAGTAIIWLLVPRYGALGAAIGTSGALVVRNLVTQAGLRLIFRFQMFDPRYLTVYGFIFFSAVGLLLVERLVDAAFSAMLALACGAIACLLVLTRKTLRVADTFPELLKLPLVRALFA